MKKLLLTLVGMICSLGISWGAIGDFYYAHLGAATDITAGTQKQKLGSNAEATSTFFTINSGGGYNTKYACTYNSVAYTSALKMNSSSSISFSTNAKATLVIVQSTKANGAKKFKLDDTAIDNTPASGASYTTKEDATNYTREYTWTNLAAGSHTIKNSDETGICYVKVTITGEAQTKCTTPTINANTSTGEVTITNVANGTCYYTTDGSTPTASSTAYTAAFNVEDGTIVKAIVVAGSSSYINSDVATKQVLLDNITCAAPTFKVYNGSVAISTTTPVATIEYSLDGTNYSDYAYPYTFTSNGTIYARAKRDGATTSEVAKQDITAVASKTGVQTVYLSYGAFNEPAVVGGFSTLVGKSGNDADGWSLVLSGNSGKVWTSGTNKVTTPNGDLTSIKVSNGAENTLKIKEGCYVQKITMYSFVNAAPGSRTSYWTKMGEEIESTNRIPLGCTSNYLADSNYPNPDVRVFSFDNVTSDIKFNQYGEQLCFVMAIEYTEVPTYNLNASGYATFSSAKKIKVTGAQVYTAELSGTTITCHKVESNIVPAYTGVLLYNETASAQYSVAESSDEVTLPENTLKATTTSTGLAIKESSLVLSGNTFVTFSGEAFAAGKAYFPYSAGSGAKSFTIVFDDDATAINGVTENNAKVAVKKYVKNGKLIIETANGTFNAAGVQVK